MTAAQRTANLVRIAEASVAIELLHGIPAEVPCGQCIIESAWLAKSPGNNCFGIKARSGQPFQALQTTESLTLKQIQAERAKGVIIISVSAPNIHGKRTVVLEDEFALYNSLTECFQAYADLLIKGKYFKARFVRYQEHLNVLRLLNEMSGSDGQPPYFTDPNYVALWQRITNQNNVLAALDAARRSTVEPVRGEQNGTASN